MPKPTCLRQILMLAMSEHHSGNNEEAQTIADAQIKAIEDAGLVVRPKEPTNEMISAGSAAITDDMYDLGNHQVELAVAECWISMSEAGDIGRET